MYVADTLKCIKPSSLQIEAKLKLMSYHNSFSSVLIASSSDWTIMKSLLYQTLQFNVKINCGGSQFHTGNSGKLSNSKGKHRNATQDHPSPKVLQLNLYIDGWMTVCEQGLRRPAAHISFTACTKCPETSFHVTLTPEGFLRRQSKVLTVKSIA